MYLWKPEAAVPCLLQLPSILSKQGLLLLLLVLLVTLSEEYPTPSSTAESRPTVPPTAGVARRSRLPDFHVGSEDLNSGPHHSKWLIHRPTSPGPAIFLWLSWQSASPKDPPISVPTPYPAVRYKHTHTRALLLMWVLELCTLASCVGSKHFTS